MYLSLIMPAFQPFFYIKRITSFYAYSTSLVILLLLMGMAHLGFRSKNSTCAEKRTIGYEAIRTLRISAYSRCI